MESALDFICNMRNYLYGTSAVITAAFFVKYRPVDLSSGNIGILGQAFIDKTFIMSQVQVSLSSVIGNKYLAVLYRVHCAWVNVNIRIEFLHGYFVTACF